jgi:hypothetical protein
MGARKNLWLVCVAPLQIRGLRGKKSTPSIGWEVPVKSLRSGSGSCMERVDVAQSGRTGNGMLPSFEWYIVVGFIIGSAC